jgi:hypothetical protein
VEELAFGGGLVGVRGEMAEVENGVLEILLFPLRLPVLVLVPSSSLMNLVLLPLAQLELLLLLFRQLVLHPFLPLLVLLREESSERLFPLLPLLWMGRRELGERSVERAGSERDLAVVGWLGLLQE